MCEKVLLISYYWHPALGPAVQRWSLFVDEMEKAGITPYVLTVKNGTYPAYDPEYNQEEESSRIIRTATREPFGIYNWLRGKKKSSAVGMGDVSSNPSLISKMGNIIRANFFIPDARVGWKPFAVKKAKELIKEHDIRHVITTGPPQSTHLIGRALKKALPEVFWLADFRDPWVNMYYNKHLLRMDWAWKKDQKLESSVLSTADKTVVVSPGVYSEFADRAKSISLIMNGFDEEDFEENPQSKKEKNFVVSYTGNLTDNQIFDSVWAAFKEVIESHPQGNQVVFRFTGNVSEKFKTIFSKYGLRDRLEIYPYCPHAEAVQKMVDSDLLLLPIPLSSSSKFIIPAKIFEYLASGTPLLAIGPPEGNSSEVLQKGGAGPMIDYSDQTGIEGLIFKELTKWEQEEDFRVKRWSEAVRQFSRQEKAKKLVSILKGSKS
jgi:glycosyltransferase involved in cell wall biosynthesis